MAKETDGAMARGQGMIEWYEALISALVLMVALFSFFFRIIRRCSPSFSASFRWTALP